MARSPCHPARSPTAPRFDADPQGRTAQHEPGLGFTWSSDEPGAEFDYANVAKGLALPTDYDVNAPANHAAYRHPLTTRTDGFATIDPTNLYGSFPEPQSEMYEGFSLPDAEQWSPHHHAVPMLLAEPDEHSCAAYMAALVSPDYSNWSTVPSLHSSSHIAQTRRDSEPLSAASFSSDPSDPIHPTDDMTEKHSGKKPPRGGDGRIARKRFIRGLEQRNIDGYDREAMPSQHTLSSALTTPTEESAPGFGDPHRRNSHVEEGYITSKKPRTDRLARNRVAATKSRAKTQAAAKELEEDERQARHHHKALVTEEEQLRNQVYLLRNELLLHADCCPSIQKYLSVSAEHIARDAEECASGSCTRNRLMSTATEIVSGLHQ